MVKLGIGFLLTALVGFGVGYFLVPTKVTIKKQIQYVERRVIVKDTTTTTTKAPDGTVTVVVENKDKIDENRSGKSDSSIVKERKNLDWQVGAAYLSNIDGNRTIMGFAQRRILGGISIGVFGLSNGSGGVGISIAF